MKMSGITGACFQAMRDLLSMRGSKGSNINGNNSDPKMIKAKAEGDDELMVRALTAVFGMEGNGRINKEKTRQVVANLGLVEPDDCSFDLGLAEEEEDVLNLNLGGVMNVMESSDGSIKDDNNNIELLQQAFRIFDEDGNGFIDAVELKRVLQCLGLDHGWDMPQIHTMLNVVDLNLDGKIDFTEFQFMMLHAR
ncbi:Calcium-binding EF-hand [Corchorus capsularis]|uniref:Calcium-binding EF-hand n=1 Tax=Corchorus capsularis TaxID=210143 RepID=A0A1R3GV74_COCAP|nr:Calcium-binding EF-hand [Corchorus capsularis]